MKGGYRSSAAAAAAVLAVTAAGDQTATFFRCCYEGLAVMLISIVCILS
jgi:hypothetical protein